MTSARRLVAAALLSAAVAADVRAQKVRGVVADSAGRPISDVVVSLLTTDGRVAASTTSSPTGAYILGVNKAATYSVFARRLGYVPHRSDWFDLASGDSATRDVRLEAIPAFLANTTIRAQRDTIRRSRLFGMDMRTLGGVILPPAAIDQAIFGATDFPQMIGRLAPAGYEVDAGRNCVVATRGFPRECLPVILDGMLIRDPVGLAEVLPPVVIDYVVILRGGEIGVLYGSISETGAILIVTKKGLKRGPDSR